MRWENLTSAELDAIDRDIPVVLSIAAIEQHGPHLPVSTDAAIGQGFLRRLDDLMAQEVLILPQVAIGCSEHHMDFPGSLSVRHRVFIDYVADIITSVFRHGFRTVVLLNSHGGNQAAGQVLIEELGSAWPDRQLGLLTWWKLAAPELAVIRESTHGGVNHAGEFETSLMLHLAPDSVRAELIPSGCPRNDPAPAWARDDMLLGSRGALYRTMRTKSGGNGVVGDAELGASAKGAEIEAAVVDALQSVISSLSRTPT